MTEHENLMNLAGSLTRSLEVLVWMADHESDDEARHVATQRHVIGMIEVCCAAAACLHERLVIALTINPETNHV